MHYNRCTEDPKMINSTAPNHSKFQFEFCFEASDAIAAFRCMWDQNIGDG